MKIENAKFQGKSGNPEDFETNLDSDFFFVLKSDRLSFPRNMSFQTKQSVYLALVAFSRSALVASTDLVFDDPLGSLCFGPSKTIVF